MQRARILIVDDYQGSASELARYLETVTGYHADAAGSGAEAISLVTEGHQYAAAVIDLILHLESGLDVARRIKRLSPSTIVHLVSGADPCGTFILDAIEQRVVDYWQCRPINVTELVRRIYTEDRTSPSSHRGTDQE